VFLPTGNCDEYRGDKEQENKVVKHAKKQVFSRKKRKDHHFFLWLICNLKAFNFSTMVIPCDHHRLVKVLKI
jgi:hypothetical protein